MVKGALWLKKASVKGHFPCQVIAKSLAPLKSLALTDSGTSLSPHLRL